MHLRGNPRPLQPCLPHHAREIGCAAGDDVHTVGAGRGVLHNHRFMDRIPKGPQGAGGHNRLFVHFLGHKVPVGAPIQSRHTGGQNDNRARYRGTRIIGNADVPRAEGHQIPILQIDRPRGIGRKGQGV